MAVVNFNDATEEVKSVLTSDNVFTDDPSLLTVERVVIESRGESTKHYYVEFNVVEIPANDAAEPAAE